MENVIEYWDIGVHLESEDYCWWISFLYSILEIQMTFYILLILFISFYKKSVIFDKVFPAYELLSS